ncbi:MAG: dihydrolipoamide acetyltransferase family protein [Anaerolineae bacterium]
MIHEVILPKLGQTMERGAIVRWLKGEGEEVRRGETLFTLESDKAVLEVEARASGVLRKVLVPAGVAVPVLTVVGLIAETMDEDISQYVSQEPASPTVSVVQAVAEGPRGETPPSPGQEARPGRVVASPRARRVAEEAGVDLAQVRGTGPGGRIVEEDVLAYLEKRSKATPVARKVAAEAGLPLEGVRGTGPGSRVVKEDVERALAVQTAATPAVSERVPVTGLRKIIAERMQASHQTTARVTLTTEADATRLVEVREGLKEALAGELGFAVSYNDLLVKVAACALKEFPVMGARWAEEAMVYPEGVHVGLAVDTERGLLVPVVRDADQRGIASIARERKVLVERALAGQSLPDDLSGGTFTVTNLGMYEVDAFTPIINLPESAVLGVGRIRAKPVVLNGEICVRQMVWLSLTFDHRVVDGGPAARFLRRIKELTEQPYLLLA